MDRAAVDALRSAAHSALGSHPVVAGYVFGSRATGAVDDEQVRTALRNDLDDLDAVASAFAALVAGGE